MPNIYLKNEIGEDIAYENIDTLTVRRVEGGTATYTFGNPQATDAWNMVEDLVNNSSNSGYSTYTLQTSNGRIVSSDAPDFGVWFQSRNDAWRISTSIFSGGSDMGAATTFGAIIFNSAGNIKIWDETNNILKDPVNSTGSSRRSSLIKIDNKYLLFCSKGWFVIDSGTLVDNIVLDFGTQATSNDCYYLFVDGGLLVSSSSSTTQNFLNGVYFIDTETFTCTKIFSAGYGWLGYYRQPGMNEWFQYYSRNVQKVPGGYLISSTGGSSSAENRGLLFYDEENKTITRLTDTGYGYLTEEYQHYRYIRSSYGYSHVIDDMGIVVGSTGGNLEIWYYNFEDKSLSKIASGASFYNWINKDNTIMGMNPSYGVIVFDKDTKAWYRPVTSGTYYLALILDNGILLSGKTASVGLKYYNISTGNLTTLNTSYGMWYYMEAVDGGAIVTSEADGSGIWFFDESNITLTQLYSGSGTWRTSKSGNSVLLGHIQSDRISPKIYKNKVLSDVSVPSSQLGMNSIAPVDGGWIVSSTYSTGIPMWFVSEESASGSVVGPTGSGTYGYFTGFPSPDWSYMLSQFDQSFSCNKKYGNYRILSTYYSSCTLVIWDDVNKVPVPIHYWYSDSDTPSTSVTYSTYGSFINISYIEIGSDTVMLLGGSNNSASIITLNYLTGDAYLFNGAPFNSYHNNNARYAPITIQKDTSDGFIFFSKNTYYPYKGYGDPGNWTASGGIYHYSSSNGRVQRLKVDGYYDSTEDAPGGFYIYDSRWPDLDRCYWNNETNTLTEIPY